MLAHAGGEADGHVEGVADAGGFLPARPRHRDRGAEHAIAWGRAEALAAEVAGMVSADAQGHLVAGHKGRQQFRACRLRLLDGRQRAWNDDTAQVAAGMRIALDPDGEQHTVGEGGVAGRRPAAIVQTGSRPAVARFGRIAGGGGQGGGPRMARADVHGQPVEQAGLGGLQYRRGQLFYRHGGGKGGQRVELSGYAVGRRGLRGRCHPALLYRGTFGRG